MEIENPFIAAWIAERYSTYRPKVHDRVMDHMRRTLPGAAPRERGLDIGCGTGLSAVALSTIASQVVALDISGEMLAQAPRSARLAYIQAHAEMLPFGRGAFDIATIGCAFHWCDAAELLDEVCRVLHPESWLVIYDNGFMGPAGAFPEFGRWNRRVYRQRYPAPPRHPQFHPFMTSGTGFRMVASEFLQEVVPFTAAGLAAYLTTQSNVVAAVERGEEAPADAERWLAGELSHLFEQTSLPAEGTCDFIFGGYVSYLRVAE